jgi:hypothetical protein
VAVDWIYFAQDIAGYGTHVNKITTNNSLHLNLFNDFDKKNSKKNYRYPCNRQQKPIGL